MGQCQSRAGGVGELLRFDLGDPLEPRGHSGQLLGGQASTGSIRDRSAGGDEADLWFRRAWPGRQRGVHPVAPQHEGGEGRDQRQEQKGEGDSPPGGHPATIREAVSVRAPAPASD